MNTDMTYCVSKTCPLAGRCWRNLRGRTFPEPVWMADFYEPEKECLHYVDIEALKPKEKK